MKQRGSVAVFGQKRGKRSEVDFGNSVHIVEFFLLVGRRRWKDFRRRFQPRRRHWRFVVGAGERGKSLDVLAQRVFGCRCRSAFLSRC